MSSLQRASALMVAGWLSPEAQGMVGGLKKNVEKIQLALFLVMGLRMKASDFVLEPQGRVLPCRHVRLILEIHGGPPVRG